MALTTEHQAALALLGQASRFNPASTPLDARIQAVLADENIPAEARSLACEALKDCAENLAVDLFYKPTKDFTRDEVEWTTQAAAIVLWPCAS